MKTPKPKLKSAASKYLWESVSENYDLEDHHLALLSGACVSLDRAEAAAAILDREGLTVETAHGCKAHPCCNIERDARNLFAKYLRQLGLDVEEITRGPGRPPRPIG